MFHPHAHRIAFVSLLVVASFGCSRDSDVVPVQPDSGADASTMDGPEDTPQATDASEDSADAGSGDSSSDAEPQSPVWRHRWSKAFGASAHQHAYDVVRDPAGNLVVGGHFQSIINLGGDTLVSADEDDVFVAKLDPSGGHVWSHSFEGVKDQRLLRLAVDGDGNIVMTGITGGSTSFGGDTLEPADSDGDAAFVVKLDSQGGHLWSQAFGAFATGIDVAIDDQGDVFVAGLFSESIDFGCKVHSTAGDADAFVVKLSAAGACLWSKQFGDTKNQGARAIAVDSGGNVIVAGNFDGAIDLGNDSVASAGDTDVFAAKLNSETGAALWARRWGDEQRQGVRDIRAADGTLCMTGVFDGEMGFATGVLTNPGAPLQEGDAYVARLGEDGTEAWAKAIGGTGIQASFACDVLESGDVIVTGGFEKTIDLGCGEHTSAAWGDIYVAILGAQDGRCLWSGAWGGLQDDIGFGIAILPDAFVLAGDIGAQVDLGGGPIGGNGGVDAFLASFSIVR